MARVIEATTDVAWADEIVALADGIEMSERCNRNAVLLNNRRATFPDFVAVSAYMDDPDSLVIISHDGTLLEAYLIVREDTKLGGCQGRWVGLDRNVVPLLQRPGVYRGMLEVAVATFGWVWGRITNDTIRTFLANNIAEGAIAPEDPKIITYKRP